MVGIVNYGAGNIFSLTAALQRLDIDYGMINHPDEFKKFKRVIIPGVGHAGAAMEKLVAAGLAEAILQLDIPVLGICVGMQLLSKHSEEGDVALLGIVPVNTLHFQDRLKEKVPHMGWNRVSYAADCPLFEGIPPEAYFYFVHSYFLEHHMDHTIASCDYGLRFSAAIKQRNFWAVQFHPEKSGDVGEQLLRNFNNF